MEPRAKMAATYGEQSTDDEQVHIQVRSCVPCWLSKTGYVDVQRLGVLGTSGLRGVPDGKRRAILEGGSTATGGAHLLPGLAVYGEVSLAVGRRNLQRQPGRNELRDGPTHRHRQPTTNLAVSRVDSAV